jgi:hypothetical protein
MSHPKQYFSQTIFRFQHKHKNNGKQTYNVLVITQAQTKYTKTHCQSISVDRATSNIPLQQQKAFDPDASSHLTSYSCKGGITFIVFQE